MPLWIILLIIAVILLLVHWKGPNAVWGTATLGLVVGIIISIIKGDWTFLAYSVSIGIFVGTIFEWLGRLSDWLRSRTHK